MQQQQKQQQHQGGERGDREGNIGGAPFLDVIQSLRVQMVLKKPADIQSGKWSRSVKGKVSATATGKNYTAPYAFFSMLSKPQSWSYFCLQRVYDTHERWVRVQIFKGEPSSDKCILEIY